MEQQSLESNDCIEDIINRYSNMVYRLAFAQMRNKTDADDIFQEVFMRYLKKKPEFQSEEHGKAWFLRVTVNCSKKFWAAAWRKRAEVLEESVIFESEQERELSYELKKLPVKYRVVIHLFYYEDLSIEKISQILKRKPSTVRTQLTRGRRMLKEILEEEYHV
ncbi:RNA polymerase sigma factor [Aminipila sp.]|jgi:RNA polymerase sigma-70 factor (ECF subfamily)|uniref:RNA polymerase sigma factor n=1 Tax=Aminipila sp. TaxID=2060095 RepID=UPI0028A2672D|nr:sigma-70 family RNA polymerase sigma factor [Aminipila sp.]